MPSITPPSAAWRTALAVFACCAALLLLTTGGHTYAIDEETMLSAAYGVLERGNLTLSAEPDAPISSYGPGQSIAAAPLLWLALQLSEPLPPAAQVWLVRAVLSWFNPLVTAATAALLVPLLLQRGFSTRVAGLTALLFVLATPAWPHSKTFFAEPLTALLLIASLAAADRAAAGQPRMWLLAGLLAGLAPAVKIQSAIILPLLGLAVLAQTQPTRDLRRTVLTALAWGLPAVAAIGLLLLYQWRAFGSPLATGYGTMAETVFRGDPWQGLYGLLFSPGKGLIWYAPPLLLWPWAIVRFFRRDARTAVLISAVFAVNLLFYARLIFWHGDGAWGPRYLTIMLPLLVLPLAEVLAAWRQSRLLRSALVLTLIAALPVQLAGTAINLNAYLTQQTDANARYFIPSQSPIVGHLRLLTSQLQQDAAAHLSRPALQIHRGWSYSEGDREQGQQLPRWTTGSADFELRPQGDAPIRIDLTLSGCRPAPTAAAAELQLNLDGRPLTISAACPPRRLQLLLAPQPTTLAIISDRWTPAAIGLARESELGVLVTALQARQADSELPIVGRLLPLAELPADNIAQRRWHSDHRSGHYDVWWWYLQAVPFSPAQRATLLGVWLGTVLLLLIAAWRLRRPAV